ncbi:unnamed protein product [Didymodactylos carnosus]|uniref:AB hydrolase-1 domain-containing protein n=1 Tax=Didymodactylos carnosus TaxID=1234261 RepID=A0A813R8N3_9BILA|nr:unnamed protein product [Didymodactylos carnosus]CAF0777993.1 unnamed protein product [Didymodactylos carnosus]CAF3509879.1 unnamed protein product [Didymodactylos carnosus]CAF3560795.1 unnamed protein product [Didymodactylos carnosus]
MNISRQLLSKTGTMLFSTSKSMFLSSFNQFDLTILSKVDNYPLTATVFEPNKSSICAVISMATGVNRKYYYSFAQYLCEQHQILTVCYDYRGVGDSKTNSNQPPRGADWNIVDWARKDCASILSYCLDKYSSHDVVTVGHSFGGNIHALMYSEINRRIKRVLTISSTNSYLGYHKKNLEFLMTLFLLYVFREFSAFFYNYYAIKTVFKRGENMPTNIIRQWAHFCKHKQCFVDKQGNLLFPEAYESLQCPILAISFENDRFYKREAFQQFHEQFPNCKITYRHYKEKYRYGHFNFFRKSKIDQQLWNECAQFLKDGTIPPEEEIPQIKSK